MLGYERKKGFDTLLAAWRRLSNEGALDAELLAVGSGALSFWRRRAEALRVAGRVRFLGARDDVERVLAASDVLVAPTRYDAYGLSIHEALCREIPALVTRAAGVAEQYPDALGDLILPDPEDDAMLAARLRDCFTARDRFAASLRALGARLRTRRWTDMAREIVAVVEAEVPR
jgi:glycosyltransferase involved in cell wall biosynthesis